MPSKRAVVYASLLIASACATAGDVRYASINDAMTEAVEPFVEKTLPLQLNKDTDKVDFSTLRFDAMTASGIFEAAGDSQSKIYLADSEKNRKAAKTAKRWFQDIASAATFKDHEKIKDLYKQKQQICNGCHDY